MSAQKVPSITEKAQLQSFEKKRARSWWESPSTATRPFSCPFLVVAAVPSLMDQAPIFAWKKKQRRRRRRRQGLQGIQHMPRMPKDSFVLFGESHCRFHS